MTFIETLANIILGLALILSSFTGIILLLKGKRVKKPSLMLLGFSYLLMIIVFLLMGFYPEYQLIYMLLFAVFFCVQYFTQQTFYKGKRQGIFYLFVSISYLFTIISVNIRNLEIRDSEYFGLIDNIISFFWFALIFGWLAFAAHQSYKSLQKTSVQPWIIKRIRLVEISALIEIFVNFPDFLRIIFPKFGADLRFILLALIVLCFMIIQFLAWVMPPKFKAWLNREYTPEKISDTEYELSEEEILKEMMKEEGDS